MEATLPRSEELNVKRAKTVRDIAKRLLRGEKVDLCLGTNGECVRFQVESEKYRISVSQVGHYWPFIRGVSAAAVYALGINSKEGMMSQKKSQKVPYEYQSDPEKQEAYQAFAFAYRTNDDLVAFLYHIHMLFRGTRETFSLAQESIYPGNPKRQERLRELERESMADRKEQRMPEPVNTHIQADAYDYALVKRVQEQGFYD